jgi:uncharacterized protein (DUF3820 family)
MKMPYGKYKGMDMSTLPINYLEWIVKNFEPGELQKEAKRILESQDIKEERETKSLEEQANEILGEKPIGMIRRGYGRPRKRI